MIATTNPLSIFDGYESPKPFRIHVAQADLDDLHERLARTRWPHSIPDFEDATDFSRGVPLGYWQDLAEYWRGDFDWRAQERALNAHEQFTMDVDGQTFHVLHARSLVPGAKPLLLNHGWPASFVEYTRIINSLVDPCAHGGDEADAFHVVIPSPPGFGFSTPLVSTGWEVARTSSAYAEILTRLGYERFATHGTDTGAGVSLRLGATLPERVIGVHVGSDGRALAMVGNKYPYPDDFSPEDIAEVERVRRSDAGERGYFEVQNHHPATIGAALTDSLVGQLAWIVEKFQTWTGGPQSTPDEVVDRDQLLTNVSLYWFTRAGASSAQFYYEAEHSQLDWLAPTGVPTGWAVFDTHPLMRRAMDPWNAVDHWSEFALGGHFPAMEQPDLLVGDLRAFFRGRT
ncbi:epoxide hydrolase [Kocuria carniphila]|uniref:epoxide hydrolase family protein n=1 Tax=Kocuria carniphila TaxID=262208 RepID=UPI0028E9B6B0|nr:epoxide hydrolase [Kocuria carniphila]